MQSQDKRWGTKSYQSAGSVDTGIARKHAVHPLRPLELPQTILRHGEGGRGWASDGLRDGFARVGFVAGRTLPGRNEVGAVMQKQKKRAWLRRFGDIRLLDMSPGTLEVARRKLRMTTFERGPPAVETFKSPQPANLRRHVIHHHLRSISLTCPIRGCDMARGMRALFDVAKASEVTVGRERSIQLLLILLLQKKESGAL